MKLTEVLSGGRIAGAERTVAGHWVMIHRSQRGYHLTRYTPDEQGGAQPADWAFPNLYDLLIFARTHGFAEIDPEAVDWRAASASRA